MQDLISILARLETITHPAQATAAPECALRAQPLPARRLLDADWTTIGAEIIRRDDKGATQVLWGGFIVDAAQRRRSPIR